MGISDRPLKYVGPLGPMYRPHGQAGLYSDADHPDQPPRPPGPPTEDYRDRRGQAPGRPGPAPGPAAGHDQARKPAVKKNGALVRFHKNRAVPIAECEIKTDYYPIETDSDSSESNRSGGSAKSRAAAGIREWQVEL